MNRYLERIEYLIGKENVKLLKKKRVMVCGVGGVGSVVAEALARSGIGNLILVDFDTIDESNLNRQIMVTKDNIGSLKTDECKKRLESVSNCKIDCINQYIDEKFKIPKVDYVVDCIDSLNSKYQLVKKCHEKNIPVLSSLGTARRIKPDNIKLTTLDKTRNDPLAKAFRLLVKKEKYNKKIEVIFVDSAPIQNKLEIKKGEKYPLGSSMFVTASAGLYIAEVVFERLINNKQA